MARKTITINEINDDRAHIAHCQRLAVDLCDAGMTHTADDIQRLVAMIEKYATIPMVQQEVSV